MPNMMGMFSEGIKQGLPDIVGAVNVTAGTLKGVSTSLPKQDNSSLINGVMSSLSVLGGNQNKTNQPLNTNPTDINQSKYRLQNTDRTINGTLVADIIATKNKVTFSWDYLSTVDLKKLMDEINGNDFPTIEYVDPETNELFQIIGHCDDVSYTPHYDNSKGIIVWKDVKVGFEER